MSTIKRLNELSEELYGEFGFATLNEAQMDLVLQYYIDLEDSPSKIRDAFRQRREATN